MRCNFAELINVNGTHRYGRGYSYYYNREVCVKDGATVNCDTFDINDRMKWKVDFGDEEPFGNLFGDATCTNSDYGKSYTETMPGNYLEPNVYIANNEYCWCRATSYVRSNGVSCPVASSVWVYVYNFNNNSPERCAPNCATHCANRVQYHENYRRIILGID